MRKLADLQKAEEEFFDRVWYQRKLDMLHAIEAHGKEMPDEDIMDGMTDGMRKVEAKYGVDDLWINDDFEYGMIHGKLSALRWVMGDEWDMLDT